MRSARPLSQDHTSFKTALDTFAEQDKLTLVVGAGVPMAAGLPSWRQLVEGLLREAFLHADQGETASQQYANNILSNHSLEHSAILAKILLGNARDEVIRQVLYKDVEFSPGPGPIAEAVANLIVLYDEQNILTTNYDTSIELAVEGLQEDDLKISSLVAPFDKQLDSTDISVIHLHGLIPPKDPIAGSVILDEQDYAQLNPSSLELLHQAIDEPDTPVLFVGLSMTDPSVVQPAYRTQLTPPRHFGLFVNTERDINYPPCIKNAFQSRLQELGIRPVLLTRYGQVSQILIEVANRKNLGDVYWGEHRYGLRLDNWKDAIAKRWDRTPANFLETQKRLNSILRERLDRIRDEVVAPYLVGSNENLAIFLWARNPDPDPTTLQRWASTTTIDTDLWLREEETETLRPGSDNPAVDCLYYHSAVARDMTRSQSRWNYILAWPIILKEAPWYQLPVGAVTLASTESKRSSVLTDKRIKDTLHRELNSIGYDLLTPEDF